MLNEVLSLVDFPAARLVVDATVGAGGHSRAILDKFEDIKIIGLDRDHDAVKRTQSKLAEYGKRARIVKANYSDLGKALDKMKIESVDAILMDLGLSSYHLDDPDRGFSIYMQGPLDMRMDHDQKETAADLVNRLSERKLASIFKQYGEERYAKKIARAIVTGRKIEPIQTTGQLASIVKDARPAAKKEKIHPATKVFQALRIAVNEELDHLSKALKTAIDRLRPGGRIIVISFHSLEDRIVKNHFRDLTERCVCPKEIPACVCGRPATVKLLAKKSITPGAKERAANPRARSARLRAAEKLAA